MNLTAIGLCSLCQLLVVASQIFFKHAMAPAGGNHAGPAQPAAIGRRMISLLAAGIGLQTLWFFLWLGLLAKWELSRVFPFEGLNPVLILLAAWLFLRERISWSAWIGIALITIGIIIVSQS